MNLSNGNLSHGVTGEPQFVPGRMSGRSGLQFDSSTSYLTTAQLDLRSTYTFAAWVKITVDSGGSLFRDPNSKLKKLNLRIVDTSHFGGPVQGKSLQLITDDNETHVGDRTKIVIDQWCHIVLTMNDKQHDYYLNGQHLAHSDYTQPITGPLEIGDGFSGTMDQVLIFPAALSHEHVHHLATLTRNNLPLPDGAFRQLPNNSVNYPVPNSPKWSILDTRKSEYLLTGPVCMVDLLNKSEREFHGNPLSTYDLQLGSTYTFAAWIRITRKTVGSLFRDPKSRLNLRIVDTSHFGGPVQGKSLQLITDDNETHVGDRTKIIIDQWCHIVLTMNDKQHDYYLNGQHFSPLGLYSAHYGSVGNW